MQYISVDVERLISEINNSASKSLVYLSPEIMDQNSLKAGDIIKISSTRGRIPIVARLGEPYEEDRKRKVIRLDRFLRQALRCRLNETVDIAREDDWSELKTVKLMPPIDVSTAHHLVEHVKESLIENNTPLGPGSIIYTTFHGSNAGTTYRVIQTVGGCGFVGENTKVLIEIPETGGIKESTITFEDVGGLKNEIILLRELIQLPLQFPQVYRQLGIQAPKGILFYGPPGSGKTYLAKAIANEVDAEFYYINGPEIVGTLFGETEGNLRKMFAEAAHHAPSIILIDEIDAVAPHRGSTGAQSDVRMVTQLLSLMDGILQVDGVIVIGTTNRVEAVDTALRRPGRFDREVFVGPPSKEGRQEILEVHTREMPLTAQAVKYLPKVAEVTHGFVGADLMELCREAGLNSLRRNSASIKDHLLAYQLNAQEITVEPEDFEKSLTKIRPSGIREAFVSIPDTGWDSIGGLEAVKKQLKELVEIPLKHPELIEKAGLGASTGVLLYGPPGTGKTLLAKAVAKETGVNFLALDGPEIFSKWLGESEETIRHVFRLARQLTPSIIFFDQLDALAPARGTDSGSRTTERVVNQLLAEMDGVEASTNVMVIGATNRIDLVDSAVLRPGRFGNYVYVPLPNEEERIEIFKIKLGRYIKDQSEWQAIQDLIYQETAGMSGADLHAISVEARLSALRRVSYDYQQLHILLRDIKESIKHVKEIAQQGVKALG